MPQPTKVKNSPELPDKVDCVIVGGGIAGVATALELVERGLSVAVLEKGVIAGEQSSRNWGWCRQMGRDPRELPLIKVSMQLWREMHQRTGESVGFTQCGIAYLCETEAQLAKRQKWHDLYVGENDLSSRMIGPDEAKAVDGGALVNWKGGLRTPDDGRAEPTLAVPAMARAAQAKGATIQQNCAVRGFETQAGAICGVVTEKGSIKCDYLVVAAGAWSRRFLLNMGIAFPQLSVINSVMRTGPLDSQVETSLAARDFAIRKRADGGYIVAHSRYNLAEIVPDSFRLLREFLPLVFDEWRDYRLSVSGRFLENARMPRKWALDEVSPFEKTRRLDPQPNNRILDEALKSLRQTLPAFKRAQIAERWAGVIDVTPDVVPVIGPVKSLPGLYLSSGFSGHGFGLGPGAGRLMAEILTGTDPCVDPSPFRFERFPSTADQIA